MTVKNEINGYTLLHDPNECCTCGGDLDDGRPTLEHFSEDPLEPHVEIHHEDCFFDGTR